MRKFLKEYRWPKKGDNPFFKELVDFKSPTLANLKWLRDSDDSLLACAFKEAGDKIIEELSRGEDPQHADKFFLPIAYLYRHSLELRMKQIIKLGIRLALIEEDEKLSSALKKDHNIYKLWNYVKRVVTQYWPDGLKEHIGAAERIIQEFHNIDKSGQNLRYSEDTGGRKTLDQLPESIELIHLKDVFDGIFNFLSGSEDGLYEGLKERNGDTW